MPTPNIIPIEDKKSITYLGDKEIFTKMQKKTID